MSLQWYTQSILLKMYLCSQKDVISWFKQFIHISGRFMLDTCTRVQIEEDSTCLYEHTARQTAYAIVWRRCVCLRIMAKYKLARVPKCIHVHSLFTNTFTISPEEVVGV